MSGKAMLTMKRSRLATNVATETNVRTCQRRCISQGLYRRTCEMQAARDKMASVPYRSFEGQNCSIARALEVLGERWTLLILREVLLGRRRFEELRRNTGVATNILADRLATLVDHEILERRGEEYVPTRKAIDAGPVLVALMQWGDAHAAPDGPPRVL